MIPVLAELSLTPRGHCDGLVDITVFQLSGYTSIKDSPNNKQEREICPDRQSRSSGNHSDCQLLYNLGMKRQIVT
jgi:hypothetical protein